MIRNVLMIMAGMLLMFLFMDIGTDEV